MTESSRARLHRLIDAFRAGRLDVESFCREFERTYNMELDRRTLTPGEAHAFAALFEEVVWYSPIPEDRAHIPNYRGEKEIIGAIEDVARLLDREGGSRE